MSTPKQIYVAQLTLDRDNVYLLTALVELALQRGWLARPELVVRARNLDKVLRATLESMTEQEVADGAGHRLDEVRRELAALGLSFPTTKDEAK